MRERPHKYEVDLSEEQRLVLHQLISSGKASARQLAHARILLKIDRNASGPRWTDEQVAEAFEMSRYTVIRIRERFVNNGLDDALNPLVVLPLDMVDNSITLFKPIAGLFCDKAVQTTLLFPE